MVELKAIIEQLMEFNKILDDLENIEVHLEDEDKAILLLCALLRAFESFKDTMLYVTPVYFIFLVEFRVLFN